MKKKSNLIINTLVLFVVTLVAVAALAVVNQITMGPIEQAEINARAEAYRIVYPDAENFAAVDDTEALLENSAEVLANAGYEGCSINDVLAVVDGSGSTIGYAISATTPRGYGGDVQIAVGITKDGKLTGFDVISHSETPGFGARCTEDEFKSQFAGKAASVLTMTKAGAKDDTEFDAISGATITSTAIEGAVNSAIVFYQDAFAGGVQEVEQEPLDPVAIEKAFPNADASSATELEVQPFEMENLTVDYAYQVADGYVVVTSASNGFYGNTSQIALGIGNDDMIKGFYVVKCDGTDGYGKNMETDEFAAMFDGLKADTITTVASGAKAENNEIDAISGATFSTNAVNTAVNGAVEYYNTVLKGE